MKRDFLMDVKDDKIFDKLNKNQDRKAKKEFDKSPHKQLNWMFRRSFKAPR